MLTKTAGQIQNEIIKKAFGKYSSEDLGYAISEDIDNEVHECIKRHLGVFSKDVFCVVLQLARDKELVTLIRRKFYAWPYLPSPNPAQSVFLYDEGKITFLWSLPDEYSMISLTEMISIPEKYKRMAMWSKWFYEGTFWNNIRKYHGIDMLSEHEFNRINRENGGHFINDDTTGFTPDSFYLPEIRIKKLERIHETSTMKSSKNAHRKATG